jgi:hypothetical protein
MSPQSTALLRSQKSLSQEIPHTLWDLKPHYSVHKSPQLDHILNLMNPNTTADFMEQCPSR